ncbi:hypothetical protein K469DRAFT_338150 [Zopfia rhizophila CBS 207.26]|uniref:Uncharacterized protein n=1 Tax=Zopfia rhizophila CBS 207.26 TaxID=1314779 RepID=A0A6A6DGM9_9PEZI|nr:hypothetical protein K469DRAFT_338150 [Zopfia rhizophila CBS 207.26]
MWNIGAFCTFCIFGLHHHGVFVFTLSLLDMQGATGEPVFSCQTIGWIFVFDWHYLFRHWRFFLQNFYWRYLFCCLLFLGWILRGTLFIHPSLATVGAWTAAYILLAFGAKDYPFIDIVMMEIRIRL